MIVVIGSGPTGVACARALLERKLPVTMIDAGLSLESHREQAVISLRSRPREGWTGEWLAPLLDGTDPGVRGLPGKRTYGSDFAYRPAGMQIVQEGVDTLASHAIGGLSNLWGANALPFLEADIADWPVGSRELEPYYRAVLAFMPLAAARDELEPLFPLHTDSPQLLRLSPQARAMLARLRKHRPELHRQGLEFGQSRLAVRTADEPGSSGCVYCGLCLYGCPHELIYTSASTVRAMQRWKGFTYLPGVLVERFEEQPDGVRILGRKIEDGSAFLFRAERAFIAAGAVHTTGLVLASTGARDREVDLLDSQYFMVPLVTPRASGHVLGQDMHALSQLALELRDQSISKHHVHLLLYTFNDLFRRALEKLPLLGTPLAKPLRSAMLDRLSVIQGYLHSDDSARIAVRVETIGEAQRIVLRARPNEDTVTTIRRVVRKLAVMARYTGSLPVAPMVQVGLPGKSYHVGGSFPMSARPTGDQTDLLGTLPGHRRVHVVDSSVFPSVPATNSTLGAMANAYRIGVEAGE